MEIEAELFYSILLQIWHLFMPCHMIVARYYGIALAILVSVCLSVSGYMLK